MAEMNIDFLFNSFAQTLGKEGAQKLVNEAVLAVGLSQKALYTKEEIIKICEGLKKERRLHSDFSNNSRF
jgi:hypothetical protein